MSQVIFALLIVVMLITVVLLLFVIVFSGALLIFSGTGKKEKTESRVLQPKRVIEQEIR